MRLEKPIMQFIEEHILSEFSEKIQIHITQIESEIEKEEYLHIIFLAYKEGINDGIKLATWLYD